MKFVDRMYKFSKAFKPVERLIIVTERAFYDVEITGAKPRIHHRFVIPAIKTIKVSSLEDNLLVIHMPTYTDVLYSLERKSEVVFEL